MEQEQKKRFNFQEFYARYPQVGPIVILFVLIVVFSQFSSAFLTTRNLNNVWSQVAANSVAAFGVTLVLLVGGIDLSIGSVIAVVCVLCAHMLQAGQPILLTVIVGLGIGASFGLFNGLIITTWKIQPFLATLGTMSIGRGLALIICGGESIYVNNPSFGRFFAKGSVGGIPTLILWVFGAMFLMYIIASRTPFGRRVQAIGGNEEAATNSGLKVKKIKILVYMIAGMMSALSGLIILSRLGTGLPISGQGAELDAIAAAVLGGTGFSGEGGNMFGTLLGALVIQTVMNGLSILGVHSYVQQVVKGVIIILTVVGAIVLTRKRTKTKL